MPGPSTPSQTAWALMGLIAGGDTASLSVQHGIEYLLETQQADGSWAEKLATGTGFPRVFYLNYHYYRLYFPLIALSAFVKSQGTNG
jgi:squalene-hopene/tetraprenyl-beta-curcumene cyclase